MTKNVNSQALIIARESRGVSQGELATETGLSQGAISKAENDALNLSPENVDLIAAFLDFPPAFFYEEGRLRDGSSMCHYHLKRKTLPAKVLSRVNATMFVRVVNIRHMMRGLEIAGPLSFHAMDIEEFGSPENVARALRTAWRIPDGPIPDLTGLIESAGAIVILSPFGHRKLSGMSCWPTRDIPLFYLNSEISTANLRWAMAHELGHLTMHGTPSPNDIEKEAEAFAAEFLAPSRTIAPDLKALSFQRLGPLKIKWRISMKALIYRASALGCIGASEAQRLYKRYSALGFNAEEPYEVPAEHPTLARKAAQVHLTEHSYSPQELRDSVRITNADDYYEVTGLPLGRGGLSIVGGRSGS